MPTTTTPARLTTIVRERRSLLLFTKPAVPGRVKTRLHSVLSPAQAAALHRAFLADLCERLAQGEFELVVAWALESGEEPPPDLLPVAVPGLRQSGADLGARLFNGLAAAARRSRYVAAVGSDHPDLPLAVVEEAFARLEGGKDLVLGPAADGGYYLVGCRAEALTDRLFDDIPWSGPEVLRTTLERACELDLDVHQLSPASDVDTPEDLERLRLRLAASGAVRCPRTTALLAEWGAAATS